MNKSLSMNKKCGVGRHKRRSLSWQMSRFLSKQGLVKPANKISLCQQRQKKATGTALLLQALFSTLFLVTSVYAMKASPIPKTVLAKFNIRRLLAKSTFYREICNLNMQALQAFNDTLLHKAVNLKEKIIVTLDAHPIKVWSRNYDGAAYGASSCGKFFGYKVFAAILHGTDIVIHHLLAPANYNELDFAVWQVSAILQKLPRIDVLLIDRGYFSFEFFAFLILKSIGFVTVAKEGTATIQPYLRGIASCAFHDISEYACYHEALLWFPNLRRNMRVIFVRKFIKGEMHEYELISNLPSNYSAEQVIQLYSQRQGREEVFDRLKNELRLHKPCKIVDFAGIQAFVALTITAYNIYTFFCHNTIGAYVTVQVMYRWFLFGCIDEMIASRQVNIVIEEVINKTERYKQDSCHTAFSS